MVLRDSTRKIGCIRTYEKFFPYSIAFVDIRTIFLRKETSMLRVFFLHCVLATPLIAQVPQSVIDEFRERKGILVNATLVPGESTTATTIYDFSLVNDRGDTARGSIRLPKVREGHFPVAFLVVGVETGKAVVKMIEGYDSVIVVGIDYPFKGPYDFSGWNAVTSAFAMRAAAYRTVPQILLSLEWLLHHPLVDTNDITIIAVSFGVFTAIPAAVIEKRVHRLAVVQAGGDLAKIIAANSERLSVPLPAWLAGWLGGWILAPFEPNRYIGAFAPRPVLIVSGEGDILFPLSSVESLFEHASQPKEWIKHHSSHVMPGEQELINELTRLVAKRLYGKH